MQTPNFGHIPNSRLERNSYNSLNPFLKNLENMNLMKPASYSTNKLEPLTKIDFTVRPLLDRKTLSITGIQKKKNVGWGLYSYLKGRLGILVETITCGLTSFQSTIKRLLGLGSQM